MTAELDVRSVRKADRHPRIVERFETLAVGESFVLVSSHDPVHLRDEFDTDRPAEFGWEYLQRRPGQWKIRISRLASTSLPRILCDTRALVAAWPDPDAYGAVWKLPMGRRHLDSNIIRLQPHSRIEPHAGPDLDVLLHILQGDGWLGTEVSMLTMSPGGLIWIPRLSRREVVAGEEGLTYLTVHPRRPGMTIQADPRRR